MGGLNLRFIVFATLIAVLLCSMNIETCNARRGKHWRQRRGTLSSLYSKNGKNHGNGHHQDFLDKSKPKHKPPPPSPKPKPTPPSPKPNPPPPSPVTPPPPPPDTPLPPAPSPVPPKKGPTFDVTDYGAKGDGSTDDTKAFQAAWADACQAEASTIIVPSDYEFLVGPVSFSGPYCQKNIVFQLDGTIVAPTNSKAWGSGLLSWIEFKKLVGFTIRGKGTIDGRGSVWWTNSVFDSPDVTDNEAKLIVPLDNTTVTGDPQMINSLDAKMPGTKPTALRLYGSFNVTITGITIQNSPQCHLKFDSCEGVAVYSINISSPGDSPNTDGIHLQNSKNVLIHDSDLGCGDDCVSIQTGCANIYVHDVNCGPGHGISIGGLGRDGTTACVSNITVRDVNMQNTMTGVRIKTWQGGAGSVQGVLFSNIQVSEVQFPIMIDQYYCDKNSCKNQSSAVALSGISYEKIRGTYTVKPVHLSCSDSLPCLDVKLTDIELKPAPQGYHMYDPFCWQAFGELYAPTIPDIGCLQEGQPPSSWDPSDYACSP